ncbi:matrilin-2-like [Biomphalaria glabrata]|uniref:Matrilin-2-like n=1 Tax=Biomphalaria glabrata TaxID=6526 RepID=A0A9W2YLU6_BIOGL|nr:matrilin-2-like [Biomphalaria glabrata]
MNSIFWITLLLLLCSHNVCVNTASHTFTALNISGNVYCLSEDSNFTYFEARDYCPKIGGEIVFFKTNLEYFNLFKVLDENSNFPKQIWIHFWRYFNYLSNQMVFSWSDELFGIGVWLPDEPSDQCIGFTKQCCARIKLSNTRGLADYECTGKFAALCRSLEQCTFSSTECSLACQEPVQDIKCLSGFILDSSSGSCLDEDECAMNTSRCQQKCVNTQGSYSCDCDRGYTLSTDNVTCRDIDECLLRVPPCQQICRNTNGSFHCECYDGYTFRMNNGTCVDVDECGEGTHQCEQLCNNTVGSYVCDCMEGFLLSSDGHRCTKIDPCLPFQCQQICVGLNQSVNCQEFCKSYPQLCDQDCVSNNDSYLCTCRSGYELDSTDNKTCHDIDECSLNSSLCEVFCINTPGSYFCSCPQGYRLAGNSYSCEKSTLVNYCPCSCLPSSRKSKLSYEQLTVYLQTLSKSLQVARDNLLSHRLQLTSQKDDRPTSNTIGYSGIIMMSFVFGIVILPDLIALTSLVIPKLRTILKIFFSE